MDNNSCIHCGANILRGDPHAHACPNRTLSVLPIWLLDLLQRRGYHVEVRDGKERVIRPDGTVAIIATPKNL